MAYEYFYPGTQYSLEPNYGEFFSGYKLPAGKIGAPTGIQTANQIQDVTNLLNQGIKTIELQPISPEIFEQIPKQHFREINRLQKLTGASTSVHAPMIDPAGFTREGWSETEKKQAEEQLKTVVEKAHELDPNGNIPITIHASAIPGSEWMPGKEGEPRFKEKQIIAVNQETGQLVPVKTEKRFYPDYVAKNVDKQGNLIGGKELKAEIRNPKDELKIINSSEWHNNLTQTVFYKNRGDDIMERYLPIVEPVWERVAQARKEGVPIEEIPKVVAMTDTQKAALEQISNANEYYRNAQMVLNNLYSKAYKFGTPEEKEHLQKLAKTFEQEIKGGSPQKVSQALQHLAVGMQEITPQTFIPVEDFAKEKTAETLGNVAFHGYKKFGPNAPIVSIENLYPGMAFSRSKDIKELVEKARERFVKQAESNGLSADEAENAAKKLIGVTWDVGHLNIMKKEGFEKKDIIKETEEIAKFVKHVHLTDNFGHSDSHLPPGMGNVPIKEIMEELEKKGYSGRQIIEAGGFVQHFKISPHKYVLEAFGSPLYPMLAQPTWNQMASSYGNYFAFPSAYMPEHHFSLYGGGFSNLPQELGGQVQGKGNRLTGTPME